MMSDSREVVEIPGRLPTIGPDAVPGWLTELMDEFEGSKWERQEIRRAFWNADSDLRSATVRVAGLLTKLHEGKSSSFDSSSAGNASQNLLMGMANVTALEARIESMQHGYYSQHPPSDAS